MENSSKRPVIGTLWNSIQTRISRPEPGAGCRPYRHAARRSHAHARSATRTRREEMRRADSLQIRGGGVRIDSPSPYGLDGLTDYGPHPVYQTKWLKWGLEKLGMEEESARWAIPEIEDSYDHLFWWAYNDIRLNPDKRYFGHTENYPYLTWAENHALGLPPPLDLLGDRFPMTWEREASQARYLNMEILDPELRKQHSSPPHTWHGAEAFLYLILSAMPGDRLPTDAGA